jgi:hypothetical protein
MAARGDLAYNWVLARKELAVVVLPLLGYFFGMIAVLTAAVGMMIGLSSTSERVRHYPRPAVERNLTATNREPRLFMVAPAKNMEANSASVPTEKAEAKKAPHKPKVLARQRNKYEHAAEEIRNGPQRLFCQLVNRGCHASYS